MKKQFESKETINYWRNIDLYIGGSEHATGHLLYVRFWAKFLFDLGLIPEKEPAKKLINQGMIQGVSEKIFLVTSGPDTPVRKYVADKLRAFPEHEGNQYYPTYISSDVVAKLKFPESVFLSKYSD